MTRWTQLPLFSLPEHITAARLEAARTAGLPDELADLLPGQEPDELTEQARHWATRFETARAAVHGRR